VSAPVSQFVESLQHVLLCQAALRQKNYTRALQHFETMARAGNQDASEWLLSNPDHVKLLQKIYVGLEEPDLLSGIASIQQRSSLEDKLLQYEAAGRWVDSLNAVDQSLQMPNNDPETSRSRHIYRLKCLINLNLYDSALSLVKAELADKIHYNEQHAAILRGVGVDAARRLGKWPVVDEFLKQGCQSGFDLSIAQTLLALQKRDEVVFKKSLQACRIEQMSKLSATVSESYARSYPIVARLHMLSEMEKSWALVSDPSNKPAISDMLQLWENRSQVLQPSFSICEPVLSLRMSICDIFQISGAEVDKTWLKIAQIARVDKKFQLSQYALMRIKNQESATTRVERAQLEMDSGHLSDAISEVSRVLEKIETLEDVMTCIGRLSHESDCEHNFFPPNDPQERQAWGQAIMFTLKSIDASGDASRVLTLLHALTTSMKAFGEGHLAMARFLDRYTSETSKQNFDFTRKISGVMASVILAKTLQYYVNALEHGSQFIYQVGPRLMTLWLDFTEKAHLMAKEGKENVFLVEQAEIKRIMNDAVDTLPAGMWYTVLPQLISRVTHPDQTTWEILQRIIAEKLLENYPRHVPWHLIAWSKGNQQRMDRYKALRSFVNGRAKHTSPQFSRILDQAEKLGEFLLDVAMYDVEEKNTVKPPAGKWIISLKYIMGQLNAGKRGTVPKRRAMLPARPEDFPFDLVVPVESELFHLPLTESLKLENTSNSITIKGFGDEVEVMKSMVKPRRIEMIGSNGITYSFLAKPKDDLRKDARVTDFNNVVNYLLKQDPEGRRRQLVIRTYGVIVLNTECGLLSWVPNTHAMRHLTSDQYEAIGRPIKWISNQFKRDFYDRVKKDDNKSEDIWRALIKKYCKPSRFWRWFVLTFPDPNSWYRARMAFTRTAAVMSMVGHILGLGDRHGENILIDGRTGDCVHVDLNCVFHKGQTFTVPERVPFRLTHNMVDAMGVTGYNGTFRAVSELTMSVLRKNKETLLSVLNTLLHDPLLDWSAKAKGNELVNPEAIGNAALAAVGDRLDGIKRDNTTKADLLLPMSVESLVDSLIRDATSDTNLKDMYLGWMAYI
jgi:serine/threonine-protein kinase ATR